MGLCGNLSQEKKQERNKKTDILSCKKWANCPGAKLLSVNDKGNVVPLVSKDVSHWKPHVLALS